jgi:hypothetical protein
MKASFSRRTGSSVVPLVKRSPAYIANSISARIQLPAAQITSGMSWQLWLTYAIVKQEQAEGHKHSTQT